VVAEGRGQVAGLLGGPTAVGMGADPADEHLSSFQFDEEQHGLAVGDSEDRSFWTAFLRQLRTRGLGGGAPGHLRRPRGPAPVHRPGHDRRVVPYVGQAKLAAIDGGTLNHLYAQLIADGRRNQAGGGLSPRSVRYVHTILHRALKDAVRWGRLARNPTDAADPPRTAGTGAVPRTWTPTELGSFLDRSGATGDRYHAAWVVLATTGMRRGEALGLRWSDVDLDAGTASIQQTVVAVRHNVSFGTPKTAKGRRSITLDAKTVATLRRHRVSQNSERLLIGAGWRDHDLLFTKVDGSPIHPERFSREFDRRVERWVLPRIRLHDLRHTWATLALGAGIHPKVVQERLGHAAISITLDTYSHVTAGVAPGRGRAGRRPVPLTGR
jgi:integrase